MISILLQYAVPVLLGFLGGVAAQYLGLDVERRRARRQRRQAIIDDFRKAIVDLWPEQSAMLATGGNGLQLIRSEAYAKICGHLSPELRRDLEPPPPRPGSLTQVHTFVVGGPHLRVRLLKELSALERQWGLA